ncbi:hypothetical protein STCU_12305 [Strigomonas culicis]|uniref:Uncharacterized protein n=1 Tax=Strigomonas culicis TaxID=28005 RepID=S9UKJ1_9TRYP|nr:hypothetical protein STCU_12305 [Strigomonas culicis]|eukprot:EPY15156.1 hypothetical protein STCU_12305 [Strigomonas culicis]
MSSRYAARGGRATEAEVFAKSISHCAEALYNEYRVIKKYGSSGLSTLDPYHLCHELPLDAWVLDVPRRQALMEAHAESFKYFRNPPDHKVGEGPDFLLGWLPYNDRVRIVSGILGDRLRDVVMRAFRNCSLVLHEAPPSPS